jgi:hypothetical protein
MALSEEREQEPVVALARELRLANEQLAEAHKACEEVLDISTDALNKPFALRVKGANLYVAAIREANSDYTREIQKAIDRYEEVRSSA